MGIDFFAAGWGVGFTIYVALQLVAAIALQRRRRIVAMLPAPVMLGVLLWTIFAYRNESSLWPVVMIFASPMAIIGVATLWLGLSAAQKREAAAARLGPGP